MAGEMVIGVDVGGTNMRAALVSWDGRLLAMRRVSTVAHPAPEQSVDALVDICTRLRHDAKKRGGRVGALGLGVAGKINPKQGLVLFSPNLPHLNKFPLGERLAEQLHLPVAVDNDANVFGMGENWQGKGKAFRNWIGITLGTGVGGCLIFEDRLWHGDDLGFVAEIGHMIVLPNGPLCACGQRGCLEALASGSALVRGAKQALKDGRLSDGPLYRALLEDEIDPAGVYFCAKQGDDVANKLFVDMGWALGIALANLFTVLGMSRAILGGGVSASWDAFIEPLLSSLRNHSSMLTPDVITVDRSQLGDKAALLGAARLAQQVLVNRR